MDIFTQSFIETIKNISPFVPQVTQFGIHSGYCSKISTQENHFYFCFDHEFLRSLSSEMLFDDNPPNEDLYDLSKEIANLVIGHAKVLLAQQEIQIQITTPIFLGETTLEVSKLEGIHFAVEKGKCSMYKEKIC